MKFRRNRCRRSALFSSVVLVLTVLGIFQPWKTQAQFGTPVWTNTYQGPMGNDNEATAIKVGVSGDVFVTGRSVGLGFATLGYANDGTPLWTNYYRGPGILSDQATALMTDVSNNVFVVGYSSDGNTAYDYLTIKYSAEGVPLWTNRYNGPGNFFDYGRSVAVDSKGNVFVTGNSYSGNAGSSSDYATIKYSNSGVPLWTNRFNGPGNGIDLAASIGVDGEGNVFVAGYSAGLGTSLDFAAIKYSNLGLPIWTNRYNGSANRDDVAAAMAVGNDGTMFLTGYSSDSSDVNDYVTIKYSGAGLPLWTNRFNGSGNGEDRSFALAIDHATNVLVTGLSTGNSTSSDYATIKYSYVGASLWTNYYNGTGSSSDRPNDVKVDRNGNVFVTGYSDPADIELSDFVTIAYSEAGVPVWTNRYNGIGGGEDKASALALDNNNNVFVAGFANGTSGHHDYVTIKYSGILESAKIALQFQTFGQQIILIWTNSAFVLQAAPTANGFYTNVAGAASPYTNSISAVEKYFRLKSN